MKYDKLVSDFLARSPETVDQFAQRAGVHRSSVYRAMNGQSLRYRVVEKIVEAAGYRVEAVPKKKKPAKEAPDA